MTPASLPAGERTVPKILEYFHMRFPPFLKITDGGLVIVEKGDTILLFTIDNGCA